MLGNQGVTLCDYAWSYGSHVIRGEEDDVAELLRMENVSKCFGSFYANQDVNLTVGEGEVHTLLGENGAGKSTLMNVLIGLYQPTEGKIYMHGKEVHISSPGIAVEHGIGMVHQHFMLIEDMTGLENIILGDKRHKSPLLQVADDRKTVEELMERYGMDIDLDEKVGDMSIGMQQRVEIMKVLFRGADILILDEPTAVLTPQETEKLFAVLRNMKNDGKAIVIITHKMNEVESLSDRVAVLRHGEYIGDMITSETNAEEMTNMMVGRAVSLNINRAEPVDPKPRIRVEGLTVPISTVCFCDTDMSHIF